LSEYKRSGAIKLGTTLACADIATSWLEIVPDESERHARDAFDGMIIVVGEIGQSRKSFGIFGTADVE
jgi:hypothetical protein